MTDEIVINNSSAYINDEGHIVIPIRGEELDRREYDRHVQECYENLPTLEVTLRVDIEEVWRNRDIKAYYTPCCDIWWRIARNSADFGPDVEWRQMSKWRVRRWRKKGWI